MLESLNLKNISKKFAIVRNSASFKENEAMRAIAYSMDLLIPGLYIWLLGFSFRIGGSVPDDIPYKYPGKINPTGDARSSLTLALTAVPLCWNNKTGLPHSHTGIGLVLPGYRIFTTYQGSYDPKQTSNTGANNF